jgi:hypothetical protein
MDNLDRDVREAQRLGYGVHYGRYKADHPHTKPDPNAQVKAPEIRECRFCGKEYVLDRLSGLGNFCSDNCKLSHRRANNAQAVARSRRKKEPRNCKVCGKDFIPSYSGQKYCSRSCASYAKGALYGVMYTCAGCGKEFKPRAKTSKYCSLTCCYQHRFKKPAVETEENN